MPIPRRRALKSRLPGFAVQLAGQLAVLALIFPLVGPAINRNFAERQPNHSHVYFGAPDPDHLHSYEKGRDNIGGDASGAIAAATASGEERTDGVVFLSSYEGTGPGVMTFMAPFILVSDARLNSEDNDDVFGAPASEARPEDVISTPPTPPPRV